MIAGSAHYDVVVIGSGPAGQNAAMEAARHGRRVLIVEREREVGGACVQYGTIPSKTLRETAVTLTAFRRRSGGIYEISHDSRLSISSLMTRLEEVVRAHQRTAQECLNMSGVETAFGRASFVSPHEVRIQAVSGDSRTVEADHVVIATGSRPRNPPEIPVDHENILDSDSVLSMSYLPQSLIVVGSGVIACEYASTFASLGVRVVMIDKYPAPLGFLDRDLIAVYLQRFSESGGRFLGNSPIATMEWDHVSSVRVTLESGEIVTADKALVAQGRVANLDSLNIDRAGLQANDRGLLTVDEFCRTSVSHIYAVGDTIGPPALASASMEQGRRAMCHAFSGTLPPMSGLIPAGIYTIPEMATIGLTESQAVKQYGGAIVGRADFSRMARAHIMALSTGLLKLVADPTGEKLLGVQIAGDGATELVHLGQMALLGNMSVDTFATTVFNFPTLAEGYRLAALDILQQRKQKSGSLRPDEARSTHRPAVVSVHRTVVR
ncbi:MAG: Si-specific NAD(P)(+) transhydrogenase [Planctomycetaceae bacterium]|nr:Si-specific NAD(P)(+) transhydrogenase [Planctomycetaceae bacterium]